MAVRIDADLKLKNYEVPQVIQELEEFRDRGKLSAGEIKRLDKIIATRKKKAR
jgi:hypothetical protein